MRVAECDLSSTTGEKHCRSVYVSEDGLKPHEPVVIRVVVDPSDSPFESYSVTFNHVVASSDGRIEDVELVIPSNVDVNDCFISIYDLYDKMISSRRIETRYEPEPSSEPDMSWIRTQSPNDRRKS